MQRTLIMRRHEMGRSFAALGVLDNPTKYQPAQYSFEHLILNFFSGTYRRCGILFPITAICRVIPGTVLAKQRIGDSFAMFHFSVEPEPSLHDIRFSCPHCEQAFTAGQESAGVVVDCAGCGTALQIPIPAALDPYAEELLATWRGRARHAEQKMKILRGQLGATQAECDRLLHELARLREKLKSTQTPREKTAAVQPPPPRFFKTQSARSMAFSS
jgi:uncharacterized coiled-coil protein SlyX/ribosomal protein S27E